MKAIELFLARFPIFRLANGALNKCRSFRFPDLSCQSGLWNPDFPFYLLTWTCSIGVPDKDLVILISELTIYPPMVFFSLLVLMAVKYWSSWKLVLGPPKRGINDAWVFEFLRPIWIVLSVSLEEICFDHVSLLTVQLVGRVKSAFGNTFKFVLYKHSVQYLRLV